MSYTKDKFFSEVKWSLKKKLDIKNDLAIPKIEKIVLNCCDVEASDNKILQHIINDMSLISAQKLVVVKAKKSIAGFKLRQGMNLGVKVTLRRDRMYEFLDRLIYMALPRVLDFRGFSSKCFDGRGNFSIGIKDQLIFPEISYEKVDKVRGFDITVCTTTTDDKTAFVLLKSLNFPFVS